MSYLTTAVVVAAGNGTRMKTDKKKPFIELRGKPILTYCLDVFESSELIDNIVLVANSEDHDFIQEHIIDKYGYSIIKLAKGGKTRQESVYNGLMNSPYCDIVLIHDAARPFIDEKTISRSISDAYDFGASVVSIPVVNTHIVINNFVSINCCYAISTPNTSVCIVNYFITRNYDIRT